MSDNIHSTHYMKKSFLLFLLILVIAGVLAVILASTNRTAVEKQPAPVSPTLRSYTDPGNHFSFTIPADWTTTSDYGGLKTGIGTSRESATRIEYTNLASGSTGVNISVYETPPTCTPEEKPNTTLGGIPAYYYPPHYSYTITTTRSTIVIGYYYPGLPVFHKRLSVAPATQAEMAANLQKINTILASFKIQGDQILQCP